MIKLLLQALFLISLLISQTSALTLSEAIDKAAADNRNLRVMRQQLNETATLKRQAESAYLPQFELNGTYNYVSRLPELKLGEQLPIALPKIKFATHHMLDFNLSGGYLLYDFGQRGKRVAQAETGYTLSELRLKAARNQVVYQTTKAYTSAALARERAELLRKYVENADSHLVDAQSKFDNGLVSEFDLLKSQLQLKIFSEELTVAQVEAKQSLIKLSEVVGEESGVGVTVDQSLSELELSPPPADQYSALLSRKPEIELTEKERELSRLSEDAEKLRPKVTLFSSAGWKNNYLPTPDDLLFNFVGGAKVSYRFFDGGYSHSRQAEEQAKQVRLQLEQDRLTSESRRTIDILLAELLKIKAKHTATEDKLQVAQKALAIASVSYGVGLITNSEFLDTQLEIQKIELDALKDRYDLLQAQLDLKNATGYWPEVD